MIFFNCLTYNSNFQPQSGTLWKILFFGLLVVINACDSPNNVTPYQGQTFIKLYGGSGSEEGKDLLLLPDGGFILVGSSTSETEGGKDVYVVRTDNIGNVIWEKKFGGKGDDCGNSVILAQNNSLYICGETTQDSSANVGFRDVYVLNISVDDGSRIGEQVYGDSLRDEYGTSILDIEDAGYLITATWEGVNPEFFMIEADENLLALPNRSNYVSGDKGVNNFSTGTFEITQNNPLNPPFICFGSVLESNSNTFNYQSFYYRTNSGQAIFQELYGTSENNEFCTDIYETSDGGYILTGYSDEGSFTKEMVVKLDPNRQEVWMQMYSNEFNQNVRESGIIQTQDGGYIVTSVIELNDPKNDEISLLKLNPLGEEEWRKTYGSNDNDVGAKVVQLEDGSYAVVGTIGFNINTDSRSKMCLMKVNPEGDLVPID